MSRHGSAVRYDPNKVMMEGRGLRLFHPTPRPSPPPPPTQSGSGLKAKRRKKKRVKPYARGDIFS